MGCDNTFEPLEEEASIFSVYGYLSLNDEEQYIRVKDLSAPLTGEATRELDATATLENLSDGTTEVLQDSVVEYDDVFTHNFRVTMPIVPETEYRLTVERSDGARVSSTATTPAVTQAYVSTSDPSCNSNLTIRFRPIEDSRYIRVRVGFPYNSRIIWTRQPVSFDRASEYYARFAPQDVLDDLFSRRGLPRVECNQLDDDRLHVEYIHFGPGWIHELYGQDPLASDVVENGVGVFGALREESFEVEIDTTSPPSRW